MGGRPAVVLAALLSFVVAGPAAADGLRLGKDLTPSPADPGAVPTRAGGAPANSEAAPTPVPAKSARSTSRDLGWSGFGVRFGLFALDVSAESMPLVGDQVREVLDAYDQLGVSRTRLDLDVSLVQVIPTLHLGGDGFFFRFDLPIGFGDGINTFGFAMYPLAYGYFLESAGLFPYVAAGAGLHYATSSQITVDGAKVEVSQSGFIAQVRLAAGAKLRLVEKLNGILEVGFSPWTAAALWDIDEIDTILDGTWNAGDIPGTPAEVVRGGAGSTLDVSVGIEWL